MTTPLPYATPGPSRQLGTLMLTLVGLLMTFGAYHLMVLGFDVLAFVGLRFFFLNWFLRILVSIVGMLLAAAAIGGVAYLYRAPKHILYGAAAAAAIHLGYAGMELALRIVANMMGKPIWFH